MPLFNTLHPCTKLCLAVASHIKKSTAQGMLSWNLTLSTASSLQLSYASWPAAFTCRWLDVCAQERGQQEDQMQLEAVLRSRDQEVSSLNHRSADKYLTSRSKVTHFQQL